MAMLLCFAFQANADVIVTELGIRNALSIGGEHVLDNDVTTSTAITTSGVTSVIDLCGHTLTIGAGDNKFCDASDITIKNGTISITGLTVGGNAVFCLDEYEKTLVTTLTLENVNLVGDGYSSAYGIFYIGSSSVLNVKGGVWSLKNDEFTDGGVFKADDSAATLNIDGLDLAAHNVRRVVTYAATTIKNSTLAISGDADGVDAEMEHGFNRSPLAISNSTITMTDMVGRGITAENGAVTIENSTITMTNCQEATIDVRGGQTVTIDDASTVELDKEPTITSGTISGDVVLPVYVAQVGDVEYTSLQAAVDAATTGQTIILLADVELTETLTIPADKTIALDLNGKTISQTKEQTAGYQMILNDGNLTIDDSSVSKAGKISYTDSGNGGEYISDVIYNRSVLVINGGTIENLSSATVASNGYPHAVDTYSGIRDTYVEINGGTIYCAEYSAIRMFCVSATNKADLVIDGGTIKGAIDMQNGTKVAALGTLTINDGTFETTKNVNNIRFANWNGGATEYGVSAEIKGGSFNGGITTAYVPAAANWDKGIISGGTYAQDMTDYCAEGFACEQNADGTFGIQEVVVAKVGDVEYTSLQEAVDAATTGQTIILLADVELTETLTIPADKTIALDLNGKAVSMADASGATAALIKNNGNLTITDGTEGKAGKLSFNSTTPSANNGYASNTISNYGTITIEAGTIENTTVGGACYALDNYAGSTATINGGKLTAEKTAVRIFNWTNGDAAKATLNVNGGEIYSKDGYAINVNSGNAPAVALNITGGTITTDDTDYNLAVYVYVNTGTAENFTASVTGGTFNGYYALNGITSATMAKGAVSITDGTFEGVICYGEPAYGFISGGTYAQDVNDYCAEGFACEQNADGTFGIQEVVVAKIGDAEYTSFKDALAAAQDGDTIKLIANVVCAEKPVYGGSIVCVDVNGYTFESNDYNRVRNVISADGTIASNNIKFVSGFGWEVYNAAGSTSYEGTNFHVFPSLEEAVAYNPGGRSLAARIYAYEDVKQTADVTLRATAQGTSSTICIDPAYEITWDLNGYTLLQESPTGNPLEACVRGKLVLDDTSDAKTGKWIAGACGVTDTSSSWYGNGGPALYVLGDGEVVLKGGTVSISRNSTVNSVGGEVVNSGGLIRLDGGKLTMAGGTLQMDDTYGIMAWGGSVVVESGNFVCGENNRYSIFAMKYYTDASVEVNAPVAGTLLLHSTVSAIVNASNVTYYADGTDYVAPVLAEGLAALLDLNGNYVVGEAPTATVNNLGATTIAGGEYSIYDGSFSGTTATDPAMPLSFVMQFLADQDEDDMATSPYADWYGDFVLTFTGLENGSFSAEGCYLAGYYGSFGWVKVPVEGLLSTIEEGVRYPVMLGVGLGQKYDYICTGVKDFRCALYIPETVLEANPNIEVKLELSVVDNSKGQDAAAEALVNGENIYEVGAYEYEAKDFNPGYLREYTINDADALDYTQAEDKIIGTLTYNRTLIEGIWNPLYLPFSVSLKNLADNYEVAYYNTMHSYDNDNNGTFETFEMEVLKLTANELNDVMLRANYPYFIRPKNADACALQIVETDATLFAAAEKVITTTSVSHTFQLKSTHKKLDAAALTGCYAISTDGDWALTSGLKPHRLYLTISANDDSPYATTAAKTIRIVARGDEGFEGTTGVDIVETDNAADGTIYDLSGRPVEEPVKGGMYIINGKKVIY